MTSGTEAGLLSRSHHIPLRRQLAAGLEAAIRDGHISPGTALPSTRDLARRLDIHRSTVAAAYARLRRRACISGGPGRRTTAAVRGVREQTRDPVLPVRRAEMLSLEAVRSALRGAFEEGLERDVVLGAMRELLAIPRTGDLRSTPDVFLLEPRPGLRRILVAELQIHLGVGVRTFSGGAGAVAGGPLLARREILVRLAAANDEPPAEDARRSSPVRYRWRALDMVPLDLAGGTRERGLVRRGVRSGLVLLVSVSECVRRYASELAAREFSRGVSFVALDPENEKAVVRAAAAARFVFFDAVSLPVVHPRVRASRIRLLHPRDIEALRTYLGPQTRTACGRLRSGSRRCGT